MERTTIILEKPILQKVRAMAREEGKTLKDTLREIILKGLNETSAKILPPLKLKALNLGGEKIDISNRQRIYEILEDT